MNITELIYPDFVANQVLTSAHLNDLREYLDEQTRLTRANLIGVGVACGLEVDFEAPGTIHLSRGVGVTTQGYLVVESDDVALVSARPYTLPTDPGYGPFVDSAQDPAEQFDMWELFTDDDVPGAQALVDVDGNLADKAVVLFLELDRAEALTCSPVDCDDRGPTVTATLRRLLVDVADLDRIISAGDAVASSQLDIDVAERLQLPDLRMPRFDVPATSVTASEEVLHAFQQTFSTNKLAAAMANALTALHKAFHPLLADEHPNDPFSGFLTRFGFLDSAPTSSPQVLFMQYYWDLFDDLVAAFDEVRWAGVELMCVCCPPEGWFPRHLMAGRLDPSAPGASRYRHQFLRSPAVGDCVERSSRFRTLFTRLVRMTTGFTEAPATSGLRVTPSSWGHTALAQRAIPHYYDPAGNPPFHHLWDPAKTARGRAHLNLGYHAGDYAPTPPEFVRQPLRFELEPNNFLRIEGHLGANVTEVLRTLLEMRQTHRLPFEVVALRTGTFDENARIDVDEDDCRFEDLVTLYRVLQADLDCLLTDASRYLYALPETSSTDADPVEVSLPMIKRRDPGMRTQPGTLGHALETRLAGRSSRVASRFTFLTGTQDVPGSVFELVAAVSDLHTAVPESIGTFEPALAREPLQRMREAAGQVEELHRTGGFDAPGLAEQLAELEARCQLAQLEALKQEFLRRVRDVQRAGYLDHFLGKHPGIQHKAGVPLGGTFILVHHSDPPPERPRIPPTPGGAGDRDEERIRGLLQQVESDTALYTNPLVRKLVKEATGQDLRSRRPPSSVTGQAYQEAVASLPDGAVIADFFLPYCCGSDCTPIQFTLPTPRLDVTTEVECTNARGLAAVLLTAPAATGSLSVQVDGGRFSETTGTLLLAVGSHTLIVRDEAGNESRTLRVTVPRPLVIADPSTRVDPTGDTYEVAFTLRGGTPPYQAEPGTVDGAEYSSGPLRTGETLAVRITDSRGCTVGGRFDAEQPAECDLPCGGDALRTGHRFWLTEAQPNLPINDYKADVETFTLLLPDGKELDLTGEVADIINQGPRPIRTADFLPLVDQRWLQQINDLVEEHVGSPDWFHLDYEPGKDIPLGTLFVDRLTCLDFRFALNVTWIQGRHDQELWLGYSADGTQIINHRSGGEGLNPPTDVSSSNKCRPDEPPAPQGETTDLEVSIGYEGHVPEITFYAEFSGSEAPVAFFWEVQDGWPSLGGEPRIVVRFDPIEPVDKRVRLTAFTKDGLAVVAEETINLRRLG